MPYQTFQFRYGFDSCDNIKVLSLQVNEFTYTIRENNIA